VLIEKVARPSTDSRGCTRARSTATGPRSHGTGDTTVVSSVPPASPP
jgi:hypothetical protein